MNDNSASQRSMTNVIIDVPPTQEFVSPCTIGSGRRSVMDNLTPTNRSRESRISALTMSSHSPVFSNHSSFTTSSLRGPQHIPDLEATETSGQTDSLLVTGHLSAVFEMSFRTDGLQSSGRDSSEKELDLGLDLPGERPQGRSQGRRSSLCMPAVPRRHDSIDNQSQMDMMQSSGPLFDTRDKKDETKVVDRVAAMTKQRSSTDLMSQEEKARPTDMLRKVSSERNLGSSTETGRVWRRGRKKKQLSPPPKP